MIDKIWIQGFRNIADSLLSFDSKGTTLIYGENNQGKTSVLEAIYVALTGKSPIEESIGRCVSFSKETFCIGMDVYIENKKERIYVKVDKNGIYSAEKDQKKIGSTALKNKIWVIFFSSEDCYLLKESPDFRRKELDWFCSQIFPEFKKLKSNFESTLKQRNAALKEENVSQEKVFFWNDLFILYSSQLVKLRQKGLEKIQEQLTRIERDTFLDQKGLKLQYLIHRKEEYVENYSEYLKEKLIHGFLKESAAHYTLYGPNRDDFELYLEQKPFQRYYSRGIQKMVSLWLKWAQLHSIFKEKGRYPILLLDDVFSEMDKRTKKRALANMDEKTQVIYTTISKEDESLFSKVKLYGVQDGKYES